MSDGDGPPLVLHVIHHLVIGGMENGLVNIVNRMPAGKFRHAIACIEDFSDFRQRIARPGVEVFALHRKARGLWKVRRELFGLCRRLRPAILHSRGMSGLDALLPARLAGVRRCVHGEHGWDTGDLGGVRFKPALLRRLHSPLVDRYIAVSRDIEQYLIRRVGISPARILQIHNGVDTARFTPAASKPPGVLPAGFDGEAVVIGTVARIQAVKDQATLLKAFALAGAGDKQLRGRIRLAIVGDGPLLQELRQLAATLGIADRVWLPGALRNVPEVMQCLDLFVLSSLSEGISNTILEAMASGIPVIASAVGGNPELVQDGHTGRLFAAGDVEGLAHLIADYARQGETRRQHGANARQVALRSFSLERMVGDYQHAYESLLQAA